MFQRLKIPKFDPLVFFNGNYFFIADEFAAALPVFLLRQTGKSFSDILPALFLGVRYDLKMISIFLLLFCLSAAFPLFILSILSAAKNMDDHCRHRCFSYLYFFYSVDFPHYSYLSQRLNASV